LNNIYRTNDLTTSLGKKQAAQQSLALINRLDSTISRSFYLNKLSEYLSIDKNDLLAESRHLGRSTTSAQTRQSPKRQTSPHISNDDAQATALLRTIDPTEKELVCLLLRFPKLCRELQDFDLEIITNEHIRTILGESSCQAPVEVALSSVYDRINKVQQNLLQALSFLDDPAIEDLDQATTYWQQLVKVLKQKVLKRKIASTRDPRELTRLALALNELQS
jgi:DNA primase